MRDPRGFRQAAAGGDLPPPGSNRGYRPVQRLAQWIVSIGRGACRFAHAETVRFDGTLTRRFDGPKVAGYQAIMRRFKRFDMARHEAVQASVYRWFWGQVGTRRRITLDMDPIVLPGHGEQEGATRGDTPGRRRRPSPHHLRAIGAGPSHSNIIEVGFPRWSLEYRHPRPPTYASGASGSWPCRSYSGGAC